MYIDWKILVGYLSVPSTVAFATGLSIAYFQDPIIVLSIYFSSISIGLAIAIFAIQNSQGAKIQEITDKIKEVTDKTQKEKEKKYDVAMGLIVDSVKDLKVLLPEREKEQKNWPQQSGPKHDESYKKIQINFMHLQNDQKELHHSRDLYGDVITTKVLVPGDEKNYLSNSSRRTYCSSKITI